MVNAVSWCNCMAFGHYSKKVAAISFFPVFDSEMFAGYLYLSGSVCSYRRSTTLRKETGQWSALISSLGDVERIQRSPRSSSYVECRIAAKSCMESCYGAWDLAPLAPYGHFRMFDVFLVD